MNSHNPFTKMQSSLLGDLGWKLSSLHQTAIPILPISTSKINQIKPLSSGRHEPAIYQDQLLSSCMHSEIIISTSHKWNREDLTSLFGIFSVWSNNLFLISGVSENRMYATSMWSYNLLILCGPKIGTEEMKMREESEKAGLKLNIQRTKIRASGPIPSLGNRWGNNGNSGRLYFLGLQNHCR